MVFIDTHAHIDGEEFDLDRDEMVARARDAGAKAILVPAINMEGLENMRSVVKSYPGFAYAMIGLHPEDVRSDWREVIAEMRRIQESSPSEFIAIGEVGLDFYWSREYEHEQLECFEEQVRWAIEARLPLVIHCRKAQNELVAILKKYRSQLCGGIFHCFAGNEKEAAELLSFDGFLIGVGGVLTFKKSHLPEVLPSIPLDRLVCETDAPYMAPVPMRGKRNESAFIPYVIERMAEAYRTTADEVARRTTDNARRLFTSLVMTMMLLLAPLTATANSNYYDNDGSILPCRGCYLRPKTANTRVGNSSSILTQPGKKKQLVILMQYPDKAFLDPDPQSYWHNALNTGKISNTNAIGSLHQYFLDQSNGIFDVDFDVRGPFTTKENRAYYGKDVNNNDQHADSLVIEGCLALDGEVDFNDYDWDGDGIVDQIIVIYAGNGQNDTSSTDRNETVWPHQWALSQYKPWKAHKQNGVIIDTYCVINDEIRGASDGFGTVAHEFSHCLGLPDFYQTAGSAHSKDNFGTYDLMHKGCYNGDSWCPVNYTAFEKYSLGWYKLVPLTEAITISGLKPMSDGGEAYQIDNDGNTNEFYLLENRTKSGWDTHIPGEGLIITHYDYDASAWYNNSVNNTANHQRAVIVPANNSEKTSSGFPYPYITKDLDGNSIVNNNVFTDDSTPSADLFNANIDKEYKLHKPVTNITRDKNKLISFDFMGGTSDIRGIMTDENPADLEYFDLQGRKVRMPSRGIYIIRNKKTNKTYKSSFN